MGVNLLLANIGRHPALVVILATNERVVFEERLHEFLPFPVGLLVYELFNRADDFLFPIPQVLAIFLLSEVSHDAPDVVDHFHLFIEVNLARHIFKVELVIYLHVTEDSFRSVTLEIAKQAQRQRFVFFPA